MRKVHKKNFKNTKMETVEDFAKKTKRIVILEYGYIGIYT